MSTHTRTERQSHACVYVYVCVCAWCININKYASKRRDNNKSNKVAPKHKTLSVFVLAPFLVPPPSPAVPVLHSIPLSLSLSLLVCTPVCLPGPTLFPLPPPPLLLLLHLLPGVLLFFALAVRRPQAFTFFYE